MKNLKKPLDHVAKQLQSKRYHIKKQENKKAYDRARMRKENQKVLNEPFQILGVKSWFHIINVYFGW